MAKLKSDSTETVAEKMRRMVDAKQQAQRISDMERSGIKTKFVVEFHDEQDKTKVTSRWHYDFKKTMNGPYLVETLDWTDQVINNDE
jgi:hypothetical protein